MDRFNGLTQNMSYCIHQVSLAPSLTPYNYPFCQDKAGHHWVPLAQEVIQNLQTGSDSLRHSATNHCVIASHGLQDHTHITDSTPLDC